MHKELDIIEEINNKVLLEPKLDCVPCIRGVLI